MSCKEKKEQKLKRLLYLANKPNRKTAFKIYSDGTIVIKAPLATVGINIPARLNRYLTLPKTKKEKAIFLRANFTIGSTNNKSKLENIRIRIKHNNYGCYIQWLEQPIQPVEVGTIVRCQIKGGEGLIYTKLFEKLAALREECTLGSKKELELLLSGGDKSSTFKIYRSKDNRIFISCKGNKRGTKIRLSDEIARYIKNWFEQPEEYFVGSINSQPAMVIRVKTRQLNRKGRLCKEIFCHDHTGDKQMNLFFTAPNFELTEQAKQELTLAKQLREANYSIKQLTANWFEEDNHKDEALTERISRAILQSFRETKTYLEEIKLESANTKGNPEGSVKCIDKLILTEDFQLYLFELKTSKQLTGTPLERAIAE